MFKARESKILLAIVVVLVLFIVAYTPVSAYMLTHQKCKKKEGFEPLAYEPYKYQTDKGEERAGITDDMDALVDMEHESHQDTLLKLGVEQSVIDSHRAFVNDSGRTTTSASNQGTREYDQNPVPFVGLRRPDYSVPVGETARVVQSEDYDRLPQATRYLI